MWRVGVCLKLQALTPWRDLSIIRPWNWHARDGSPSCNSLGDSRPRETTEYNWGKGGKRDRWYMRRRQNSEWIERVDDDDRSFDRSCKLSERIGARVNTCRRPWRGFKFLCQQVYKSAHILSHFYIIDVAMFLNHLIL